MPGAEFEAKPPASRAALAQIVGEAARAVTDRGDSSLPRQAVRRAVMALAVEITGKERGVRVTLPDANGLGRGGPHLSLLVHRALHAAREIAPGGASSALGAVYETLLALPLRSGRDCDAGPDRRRTHDRKISGAYFTPSAVVEHLLDTALEPVLAGVRGPLDVRICDPACGCGNFLIAAARRIARALPGRGGLARALRLCVFGVDNDPLAVEICRAALRLETGGSGVPELDLAIRCADALTADWDGLFPAVVKERGGFDTVVGNPPFLNQLARETATGRGEAALLKHQFPGAVSAYTDPAALFLLVATRVTRPGGRAALVLPQSVLATRDAAGVRARVLERGAIESLWIAQEKVFDAGVMVCAPTIRVGGGRTSRVRRFVGAAFRRIDAARADRESLEGSWASLGATDVPSVAIRTEGTLAEIASAPADFRDQYYGLRGCVVEDATLSPEGRRRSAPLITTGLIDAACCRWGGRPTRFDRRAWLAPRVDLESLSRRSDLGPWARARLVPKVLLATQTRALEAAVDTLGRWIPAVPVITVVPQRRADLWRVAAVLLSPVATAWAVRHHGGAGLSAGAIKLSAKQTLRLPLPKPGRDWDRAARLVAKAMRTASDPARTPLLQDAGAAMCAAYGLGMGPTARLLRWWQSLLRPARDAPTVTA